MENHITSLKIRCVKSGTNLTQICKEAGVSRQLISTWEKSLPKSFQILAKLTKAIEDHENKQMVLDTKI